MCQDISFNWGAGDPSFAKAGDSISSKDGEHWVADVLYVTDGSGSSMQTLYLSFPCDYAWDASPGDLYQINGWPTGATSTATAIGTAKKCICGTDFIVDCSNTIIYPVCAGCE